MSSLRGAIGLPYCNGHSPTQLSHRPLVFQKLDEISHRPKAVTRAAGSQRTKILPKVSTAPGLATGAGAISASPCGRVTLS
jgi:hypothetical protein